MGRNKKSKNKDGSQAPRTYWKGLANFKCSSDTCGFAWSSVHGWNGEDPVTCEFCNKQAQIVKVVDEMFDLAIYNCTGPKCDNLWKSIPDGMPQECDVCGTMVPPGGTQRLFGRHFWFACKFKECPAEVKEWEDFSLEAQPTQRCSQCGSRGDIIGFRKALPRWLIERRKKDAEKDKEDGEAYRGGPGKHNMELCDMCYRIKQQGKGPSCHRFQKVVAKREITGGTVVETIASVHEKC